MTTSSAVTNGRSPSLRSVGLVCAALAAAVVLAFGVPTVQQVRATTVCTRLGGALRVETETVEPVVRVRTVYRCYGPGGRVLASW